jgi:flagellar hook-length control protein FliK
MAASVALGIEVPVSSGNAEVSNPAPSARAEMAATLTRENVAGEASAVQPQRLVREVADQISTLAGQGKQEFQIQLHPDTLGRLHVRLSIEDGAVTIRVRAESGEARSAIESGLGSLRQSLEEQGLRVDRLVVAESLTQSGSDNQHPRRSRGWVDENPTTRRESEGTDFAGALAAADRGLRPVDVLV